MFSNKTVASDEDSTTTKKYISSEKLEEKCPIDMYGRTPYHIAAMCGNVEVCEFIFKNTDEEHPRDNSGDKPQYRKSLVCKLIIEKVGNKNSESTSGNSALHCAAFCNTFNCLKISLENVDKKNPRGYRA